MPPSPLTFRLLAGCRPSERRGIGFLEGHRSLNAGTAFENFKLNIERKFRAHMDEWLDGADGPKTYFHVFKSDWEHRNCFVFKCQEHRLYGFLCHPKKSEPRFQLCAVCVYVTKHEHESDRTQQNRVEEWFSNVAARQAISQLVQDPLKEQ